MKLDNKDLRSVNSGPLGFAAKMVDDGVKVMSTMIVVIMVLVLMLMGTIGYIVVHLW